MLFNQDIPSQVRDGSRDLTFIDLGKWSKLAILRLDQGNLLKDIDNKTVFTYVFFSVSHFL